jgi:hypothetical protein
MRGSADWRGLSSGSTKRGGGRRLVRAAGFEPAKSAKIKGESKGDAQRDAQNSGLNRHALSLVVAVWPKLPVTLQRAILAIISSVEDVR